MSTLDANFMKHAGHDYLPSRHRLESKGIFVPLNCVMCGEEILKILGIFLLNVRLLWNVGMN